MGFFREREKEGESRSRWIEGSEVWKDRRIEGVNRLAGAVEVEDWLVEAIEGVDVELEKHLGFEALDFQRAIVGSDLEAMFGGEKTRIVSSSASRLVGLPRWERGLTLPKRYCLDSSPSLIIETVPSICNLIESYLCL